MAKLLDYRVVVLDSRADMLTRERFPDADQLVHGDAARTSELVPIDATTHVVIVTHGHEQDADALRSVLDSAAASIGMIGSSRKIAEDLRAAPQGVARRRHSSRRCTHRSGWTSARRHRPNWP